MTKAKGIMFGMYSIILYVVERSFIGRIVNKLNNPNTTTRFKSIKLNGLKAVNNTFEWCFYYSCIVFNVFIIDFNVTRIAINIYPSRIIGFFRSAGSYKNSDQNVYGLFHSVYLTQKYRKLFQKH